MEISELPEDQRKAALEAAWGVKNAAGAETLQATTETTREMETGSPQTPGYEADYGQTMKAAPEWPPEQEFTTDNEVATMGTEFEDTLQEITGASVANAPDPEREQAQDAPAESNAFDQAIAEMQESPANTDMAHETPEPGGGMEH